MSSFRYRKKKSRLATWFKRMVLMFLVLLLGYTSFYTLKYFSSTSEATQRANTPKDALVPSLSSLWNQLKKRLLDQDLPIKNKANPQEVDMTDVTSDVSGREAPYKQRIENDKETFNQKDRDILDSIVNKNK